MISEEGDKNKEHCKRKEIKGRGGSILNVLEYRGEYLSPSVIGTRNHTTRDDDVYLASYPKSGSIWVYNIINMLLHGEISYSTSYNFVGYVSAKDIDMMASPRLIGSHFLHSWLPAEVQRNNNFKIVNLVRNPKDTCVSYYHYSKRRSYYQGNWDDFFELFSNGDMWGGSWFTYFRKWEKTRKENPDILLVKYEDLITDFRNQLLRLASYLGVSYDKEFYDRLEQKSQFDAMKEEKSIAPNACSIKVLNNNSFFRKGKIGDWKTHFTVAQNEKFDALYENEMKDSTEEFQFN